MFKASMIGLNVGMHERRVCGETSGIELSDIDILHLVLTSYQKHYQLKRKLGTLSTYLLAACTFNNVLLPYNSRFTRVPIRMQKALLRSLHLR